MAQSDLRKLKPITLCKLLNSTELGSVITQRQLERHRVAGGLRIGSLTDVDLIKYIGWLVHNRHAPKADQVSDQEKYLTRKEAARARQAKMAAEGRDIGELPEVVNSDRKASCRLDFKLFCKSYFPLTFVLPFSPDHDTVISQIESSTLHGELFATAMPRGSGKTTLAEVACIWASLYGHQDFIALIGSDEAHACQMLDSIKTELELNTLLQDDFPEAVYPIACLEGIANRCKGQLYKGERTHISWTGEEVILPTMPGSLASGAIIKVAGLTAGIRGMKFKRPDGKTVRPRMVIVDDPQTDASARSPSQCITRERILAGAVLGLAGPGQKICGIMPCTVIAPGDVADNILNRDKHPDWHGTRTKMVYHFPTADKLWEEYGRLRAESLRLNNDFKVATDFYVMHREAMDEGSLVAWEHRFNSDEVSALQHAMNLKLRDERAFFAEYQNDPLPDQDARSDDLTPDQVLAKINRADRGTLPTACGRLTAFIDVHATVLYWMVCAWEDSFTGQIIDYGAYPDQKDSYYTLRDARFTLENVYPSMGAEGRIFAGLQHVTQDICSRDWLRDDGANMKIERQLIDANWGQMTEVVRTFCRQSQHSAVILPSHGKYLGASTSPMSEWRIMPGDRLGLNWRLRVMDEKQRVRSVLFDTNFWKSFIHSRISCAMGDRGCLTIFGTKPEAHRLLADHLTSEYRVRTQGRGRTVDEWKLPPERPDNHWFDCLVGCAVAASVQGVTLSESGASAGPPKKKFVSFRDQQRQRDNPGNQPRPG